MPAISATRPCATATVSTPRVIEYSRFMYAPIIISTPTPTPSEKNAWPNAVTTTAGVSLLQSMLNRNFAAAPKSAKNIE